MVLRLKQEILSTPGPWSLVGESDLCRAEVVPVVADLSVTGWHNKLQEAGFDPTALSAWILEGLTM